MCGPVTRVHSDDIGAMLRRCLALLACAAAVPTGAASADKSRKEKRDERKAKRAKGKKNRGDGSDDDETEAVWFLGSLAVTATRRSGSNGEW